MNTPSACSPPRKVTLGRCWRCVSWPCEPAWNAWGGLIPAQARTRFRASYDPAATRHILRNGRRVGFVALKTDQQPWLLDHLYLHPEAQGQGVGAAIMDTLLDQADRAHAALRDGALRGSAANRFYQRHGFVVESEEEWDIYYLRAGRAAIV